MSQESASAFLKGSVDETLIASAREAPDPITYLIQEGSQRGFGFTSDELIAANDALKTEQGELSEAQLEQVAGGVPEISPVGAALDDLLAGK